MACREREVLEHAVHAMTGHAAWRRVLASDPVDLMQVERQLRERLDALGPAPPRRVLHVFQLPNLNRVERIGEFWSYPQSQTFAELLIDGEEDRTLRAVLVGMLREADR
jgi:hypothetical protein